MKLTKSNGLALLLIGCGVLILLDKVGFGLGNIMGFIFPVLLMVFGYLGIKNGRSFIGWTMMIIGIIVLFGKLSGIIGWIIAIALIAYGFHLLKNRGSVV